jgi:hypothetical protein
LPYTTVLNFYLNILDLILKQIRQSKIYLELYMQEDVCIEPNNISIKAEDMLRN